MNIVIGSRKYTVLKEYPTYYLCDFKGLYRTCFFED